MLPIVVTGAMEFLSSDAFRRGLEQANPITFANAATLPKLLTENADHRKLVFGVKTIAVYSIHSFLFQLVATKILGFQWQNNCKELAYELTKDKLGNYTYKDIRSWNGFEFCSRQSNALASYKSLTAHGNMLDYLNMR